MKNIIKKKKNVYFSNMKQIIKHYPMTDRLIVIREYMLFQLRKFFFLMQQQSCYFIFTSGQLNFNFLSFLHMTTQ